MHDEYEKWGISKDIYRIIFQTLNGLILFFSIIISFTKYIILFKIIPVNIKYKYYKQYNSQLIKIIKIQPIIKLTDMNNNMELSRVLLKKLYTYA